MIRNIRYALLRVTPVIVLALGSACGSGGNSGDPTTDTNTDTSLISNDDTAGASGVNERELVVSDTTATQTVTQCFCTVRFRSTLQFYHFEDQKAVLLIEFDNQTRNFDRTASLVVFETDATNDGIEKWINNQHSDGLFFDFAKPMTTYEIAADNISITSTAFVENLSGDSGDEYEETRIEFVVANLSDAGRYFLNGFADQTAVYLQTR